MKFKLVSATIVLGFALAQGASAQDSSSTAGGMKDDHSAVDISIIAEGWSLKQFMGGSVVNENGDKVGKLQDTIVAVDGDKAALTFGIIDVGGFLGMGKKHIAIPIDAFTVDSEGKQLNLVGATEDALKELPEFTYAKQ